MLSLFVAFAVQTAAPSIEADALGGRLAANGALASLAPLLIEKDIAELAAQAPDLTSAERERLLELGRAEGERAYAKVTAAIGREYARRLTLADLKLLVAHAEDPATRRFSAVVPQALMSATQSVGEIDLKKTVTAAFCKDTGKLCDRK